MNGVLVIADGTLPSFEGRTGAAFDFGRSLASEMGTEVEVFATGEGDVRAAGASRLWRTGAADGVAVVAGLRALLAERAYAAVILAETPLGREVAGRLAAIAGFPVVGSVLAASWRGGCVEVTRAVEGGRRSARLVVRAPVTLLIDPDVAGAAAGLQPEAPQPVDVPCPPETQAFTIVAEERLAPGDVDLAEAEIVVAGGRGMGGLDGFGLLEELARLLNGAVGATRVAVDAGWAPRSRQVGLTGKTVNPRLYIACGISGAIHHTLGMRESGFIVAINNDERAPIFKVANASLVGDAREIVANLIRELKKRRPPRSPAESVRAVVGR